MSSKPSYLLNSLLCCSLCNHVCCWVAACLQSLCVALSVLTSALHRAPLLSPSDSRHMGQTPPPRDNPPPLSPALCCCSHLTVTLSVCMHPFPNFEAMAKLHFFWGYLHPPLSHSASMLYFIWEQIGIEEKSHNTTAQASPERQAVPCNQLTSDQ